MRQIIDIFGKISYVTVKENLYRTIYKDPLIMTIDLAEKQFNNNTYYHYYYIDKLCIRSELNFYEKMYAKANESIREFKKKLTKSVSIDDFHH